MGMKKEKTAYTVIAMDRIGSDLGYLEDACPICGYLYPSSSYVQRYACGSKEHCDNLQLQ